MFGILYKSEDGLVFRRFDTYDDARKAMKSIVFEFGRATFFDYDVESDMYLEFFSQGGDGIR